MRAATSTEPVRPGSPWAWVTPVVLLALAVRLVGLGHAPHFDEYYHLLAAESLVQDGDLCIAECLGPYDRGALYSVLVAAVIAIFGTSMVAGRLVSVAAGVLLVAAVSWWTWRQAGRTAGVAAGLLLGLAPEAVYISQFLRFYAWHALLVWVGAVALFGAVHSERAKRASRRWMLVGVGLLALLGAFSLQITTLIAGVGLVVWFALDVGLGWGRREWHRHPRRLAACAAGLLVVGAAALAWMGSSGLLARLWAMYRHVNLSTAYRADDIRYYHNLLMTDYPTFYGLLPVAFVVALWRRPSAALFTGSVFGAALVLQSGGGFKAERFLFYAIPFFFALWGITLGAVLPALAKAAQSGLARWLAEAPGSRRIRAGSVLVLGLAAFCVLAVNSAYNTTFKMVTVSDAEWPPTKPRYRGRPEWRPALATLRTLRDSTDVLVTTSAVKAIHYLGGTDVELGASRLYQGSGFAPDFALDPRTGIPTVKSPEAMTRLLRCYSSGLVIIESHGWETEWAVPPETAAYIAANMREVPLPDGSDLRAFVWVTDPATSEACVQPPLSDRSDARAEG